MLNADSRHASWPLWPILLLLSVTAVVVVTLTPVHSTLHFVIVSWFLLVCPGMAIIRLGRFEDDWVTWPLSLVLSLVIDAAVAIVLLYAGLWSVERILLVLTVLVLVGAIAQSFELMRAHVAGPRLARKDSERQ